MISQEQETERARQLVERFVRCFRKSYQLLAYHGALPLVLTPELLNFLRVRFLQGQVPWVAEVDLLLSDLCNQVGYELYAMDTAVRAYLLEQMKQELGEERMQEVARLLISYVKYLHQNNPYISPKELQAQQWAAMVYLDEQREKAIGEITQAFKDAASANTGIAQGLVNRAEMARLAKITEELAPQLGAYENLVEYARIVTRVLTKSEDVESEALRRSYPIMPGLELSLPPDLQPVTLVKKILILAANPRGDLKLEQEIRDIQEVLGSSANREQFTLETREAVRTEDLTRALLELKPWIVNFCGQVSGSEGLVLENDKGQQDLVSTEALANLFRQSADEVECVLLNACYAEVQAQEIVKYINYVIDIRQEIRDDAARAFTLGFYEAVGSGESIESAYQFGCDRIQLEINRSTASREGTLLGLTEPVKVPEHLIPVLLKKTLITQLEGFPPIQIFTFEVATIAIKLEFKIVTLVPKEQISNRPKPEDIYFREDVFYEAFSRKGRYQSYEQLTNNEQEGIDYRIRYRQGNSKFAIVAHHGGKIQLGTTEIADAIAGEDYSFYTFEGIKEGAKNDSLHIPSHKFDEPRALELVSKADRVIAIHGIAVEDEAVYLGGLDDNFREQIKQSLIKEDFTNVSDLGQFFRGISPQNICNRGQTGKGVQIGISWGLRKQLFDSLNNDSNEPTLFDRFIQAIRDALSPLEAAGWRYQTTQGEADYYTEDLGNGIELDMISIPGGSFIMGSPEEELKSRDKERPQHQVTVPTFYMGRYPITQAQWQVVAGLEKVERELDPDPSYFKNDYGGIERWTRPVEQISWEDAREFCNRLSKKTEREYRLPTEAEWEYACRAGTTTPFHFGETISTELANYRGTDAEYKGKVYPGNYGRGPKGIYREQTTPVGSFKVANNFGLSDMHGNVWEWCEDDWHENYKNAPTDSNAWLSGDGAAKVIRGASWRDIPNYCRSTCRSSPHDVRSYNLGFRVVCVAPRAT